MNLATRFVLPLAVALGLVALALVPLVDRFVGQWFRADVETRSHLVFNAIGPRLWPLLRNHADAEIASLFNVVARDKRLLAIGLCDANGRLAEHSASWPVDMACPSPPTGRRDAYREEEMSGGPVLISLFPIPAAQNASGFLFILHDMTFASNRSTLARLYMLAAIGVLGAVAATVTLVVARFTLRQWLASVRTQLAGNGPSGDDKDDPAFAPVIAEIQQLLRDMEISQATAAQIRADWTADLLRKAVRSELPDAEVIVVSNREPYIHERVSNGTLKVKRPASGLVTALEPIIKACGGTWIAHGSGSGDRDTVDGNDRVEVPINEPSYTLRRIWMSEEEEKGYYFGLSNEGLWPLCHISYVRPVFRESDWERYVAVNKRFADAVVAETKTDRPLVLVQDYHLALVPRLVRERLPRATIITFWHIPWPNAEVFGICPWRERILDGLLGSNVVGFHIQLHCNNFIESADRFLECHIDREESTVAIGDGRTFVKPYPISIEWPPEAMRKQPPVDECRTAIVARFRLDPSALIAVGVERFDFTKGVPDRFRAVGILLERYPQWRGRFVLVQVAAPSRSSLPAYVALREEVVAIAEEINARFGNETYKPIILHAEHTEPEDVYTLFRSADLCIVSSLHDGMNLVAKEFVAARDDERGVLILSSFAGASRELMEALIVNPFDARATAEAINRALKMPEAEQRDRMALMRVTVSENNVFYWAGRLLLDAARLRKREQIRASIAAAGRSPRAKSLQRIASQP